MVPLAMNARIINERRLQMATKKQSSKNKPDQIILDTDEFLDMELTKSHVRELETKESERKQSINIIDAGAFWFALVVIITACGYGIKTLLSQMENGTAWIFTIVAMVPLVYIVLKNRKNTLV
jgi:hypothetical protein